MLHSILRPVVSTWILIEGFASCKVPARITRFCVLRTRLKELWDWRNHGAIINLLGFTEHRHRDKANDKTVSRSVFELPRVGYCPTQTLLLQRFLRQYAVQSIVPYQVRNTCTYLTDYSVPFPVCDRSPKLTGSTFIMLTHSKNLLGHDYSVVSLGY
jgi:hypothetical protein